MKRDHLLLEAKNIKKNFGGVRALKGVDFRVYAGEALALVGENGAGKSTLMKIMSGIYPQGDFSGEIFWEGKPVSFGGPNDAEACGISIIHQELNLFPELSVAENIFLTRLPLTKWGIIDHKKMEEHARILLSELTDEIDPSVKVASLNTAQQQMVEMAKAIGQNAKVLILDEPTSSLTTKEVESLFRLLTKLQKQGMGLVYISHKLEEVYELCDRVTVLRDGESVYQGELKTLDQNSLVSHMVGRQIENLYPPKAGKNEWDDADVALEVKNWSAYKLKNHKWMVANVSFKAYRGEILGLAGLVGAGRTDLLMSIFGSRNFKTKGELLLNGKPLEIKSPKHAIEAGMALVTEDRKANGLHLDFSIEDNMAMASWSDLTEKGLIQADKIDQLVNEMQNKMLIKMSDPKLPVKSLSGGNQQKIVMAKWLAKRPRVLFLDEPTRGIDVGAKFEIYSLLQELVKEGVCVVIASSELPEIMGVCDRVLVMREGKLSEALTGPGINENDIMKRAVGIL